MSIAQQIGSWLQLADQGNAARWEVRGNEIAVAPKPTNRYCVCAARPMLGRVYEVMLQQLRYAPNAELRQCPRGDLIRLSDLVQRQRIALLENTNWRVQAIRSLSGCRQHVLERANDLVLTIHSIMRDESISIASCGESSRRMTRSAVRTVTASASPLMGIPAEGLTFYSTQTHGDLRPLFTQTIAGAQRSIVLFAYSLTDLHIIEALEAKARAGVDVTVIHDVDALKHTSRPIAPEVKMHPMPCKGGIMHAKLLVVDEEQVLSGTANCTTESMVHDGNIVMAAKNEGIAKLILDEAAAVLRGTPAASHEGDFEIGGRQLHFAMIPKTAALDTHVVDMLKTAQKSVRVAMFTLTEPQITNALIDLHKRNVKVEVVIDHREGSGHGWSSKMYGLLKESGVAVTLSKAYAFKLLHYKLAVIDEGEDDATIIFGSANWTKQAFHKNEEFLTVVKQPQADDTATINAMWSKIIADVEAPLPA